MRTTTAPLLSLALGLLLAGQAAAHEGHEHKAIGTVTAVKEGELQVQTQDAKALTIVLDADTKYQKAKAKAAWTDLKTGDRVVVSYIEKEGKHHARLVRMAAAAAPAPSAAAPAPKPQP